MAKTQSAEGNADQSNEGVDKDTRADAAATDRREIAEKVRADAQTAIGALSECVRELAGCTQVLAGETRAETRRTLRHAADRAEACVVQKPLQSVALAAAAGKPRKPDMKKTLGTLLIATLTGLALVTSGCSVVRGQESASSYVDDASITADVKAKLIAGKTVDGDAINVQTLQGEVLLSGFAKSETERMRAGQIARSVKGVRSVRNNLVIRAAAH